MHSLSASKAARMFRWPVASVAIAAGVVIALAAGASGSTSPRPGPTGASGGRAGQAAGAQALTWSLVPSPNRGTGNNGLDGVSCVAAGACTAVGGYTSSSGVGRTLIESWNGTTWAAIPSPQPGTGDGLDGVSCISAAACTAVGFYQNSVPIHRTLIESWNGTTWSVVPSPNRGGTTTQNFLYGVSCASAVACTAVGETYNGRSGDESTLIESWNGTGWSLVPSPSPGNAQNYLNGVSCTSATTCTAVGYFLNSGSLPKTLIESWNGTAWSVVPSPSPETNDNLNSVSCTSPTACMAVGYYNGSGSPPKTLIESWNGTTWSVVPSPQPGSISNNLYGVSCISATACTAVGVHENKFGLFKTLIQSWDGASWTMAPSANPGPINHLVGVSCASAAACTAAGYYGNARPRPAAAKTARQSVPRNCPSRPRTRHGTAWSAPGCSSGSRLPARTGTTLWTCRPSHISPGAPGRAPRGLRQEFARAQRSGC
jgi:hypothetical protein